MKTLPLQKTPSAAGSAEAWDAAAVVRGIQAGDRRAEDALVAQYRLGLEVMLSQLTGNPALAADIQQETFALVLKKLREGELRSPEALPAFLRSIARNLLIADRRKEARYGSLESESNDEGQQAASWAPVVEAPQLQKLLEAEEAQRVRELLGELRFARDRELLVRYYLTDVPKDDICSELDVDPGLFNRVLYRARQRLKELWDRSEKRQRFSEQGAR